MSNYLSDYYSVQNGSVYHIISYFNPPSEIEFFNETYQTKGLYYTNLEKPYRVPNCEKFVAKEIKLVMFIRNMEFETYVLPFFQLTLYVGDIDVFNAHSIEFYSNYGISGSAEIGIVLFYPTSATNWRIKLLNEIEIKKDVNFKVVFSNMEKFTGTIEYPNYIGIFIYGTFYRKIIG